MQYAKHFIKQCQRLKAIKAIKLTVAWSLNCLHVIVCVALRCPEEGQGQQHWQQPVDFEDLSTSVQMSSLALRSVPRIDDHSSLVTLYTRRHLRSAGQGGLIVPELLASVHAAFQSLVR